MLSFVTLRKYNGLLKGVIYKFINPLPHLIYRVSQKSANRETICRSSFLRIAIYLISSFDKATSAGVYFM